MTQAMTGEVSPGVHPGWRLALPAVLLTVVAILLLFRTTLQEMGGILARSDTYAHGFLVPPITLWLIWRMRERLAVLAPKRCYPALLLSLATGFAWLLGELAAVNVVPQFAVVFMILFAVLTVLGWPVVRSMAFPLLFLLFTVPFGDFTQAKLMEWTAKFTVLGLRLSGVPVYSEGQQIVIPSGTWSVVEACSGVRYLIASLTVGTLFAYLTYQSWRRRLIFFGICIVVPVIANWGRAYMIVMLGHLSGNKLAVGVDHLIYGWIFFGLVILLMFGVGTRWREDDTPSIRPVGPPIVATRSESPVWMVAVVTVLVAAIWPLAQWRIEHDIAAPVTRLAPFEPIPRWQRIDHGLPDWQPRFATSAAKTRAVFEKDGRRVGVFLAYYRNQDQRHRLVSSTNVLVASDDPVWVRVDGGEREISFDRELFSVRMAELRGQFHTRLEVWQWYWVDGHWTSSDILAKVYTAMSRLLGRGDDSAVVVLYTLRNPQGNALSPLEEFASDAGPAIAAALRQTLDTR